MNAKTLRAMRAFGFTPAPESDGESEPERVPGFDGGARQSAPLPPETHDQWLLRVIRGQVDPSSPE